KLEALMSENGETRLLFATDRDEFESFRAPREPRYVLTSGLDSLILLRRDLTMLLSPEDARRVLPGEKGPTEASQLTDLPSHAILDRGRLVGLWEYAPDTQSMAWMSFGIRDKKLTQAVEQTEEYVKTQLGDARSFSLDSPESRKPRIDALRKAGRASL